MKVCLVVLGVCSVLAARELRVGTNLEYSTPAEALAAASSGDTIVVHAGVYPGNLVLGKRVRITGVGRPVIRGTGEGSVITVRAPQCTVEGLVVEHSGGSLVDEDSGILLYSAGNRIMRNELRDVLFGIYFYHASHNVVGSNIILGRPWLEPGERGAGLHLWNSLDNRLEDNVITGSRDGMYLQNASQSEIRRNRVHDVRYGLHYMYSDDNVFEENVFENNVAGAAIMYSQRIQLRRNRFLHNRGFSSFGILFQDSTQLLIEHNQISDNASGLFLEALRDSLFRQNLIAANDTAIELFSSAANNEFTENNFVSNLTPIRLIGRATTTRWAKDGKGNYWSDYDGYDLDGDGVGDVPYKIRNLYESLEGNHPRLRVFFSSPAAQALVSAERSFPIMRLSKDEDPRPLMRPVALPLEAEPRPSRNATPVVTLVVAGLFLIRKGLSL